MSGDLDAPLLGRRQLVRELQLVLPDRPYLPRHIQPDVAVDAVGLTGPCQPAFVTKIGKYSFGRMPLTARLHAR
jgi:hypothetical protein